MSAPMPYRTRSLIRVPQLGSNHHPLIASAPDPSCEVIVTIPVRDESKTIERTLEALAVQVDACGLPLDPRSYEVIVLANNCCDDTAKTARRFATDSPSLAIHVVDLTLSSAAHVGHARRLAMDEAWRRLARLGKPNGIIATTDGDTRASATWISATKHEIDLGADAVGGRISIDSDELRTLGPNRLRYHLLDVGYRSLVAELEALLDPDRHDPWPRHFQHFGASMAVTAHAYHRAGGLPPRPYLEDVAFYDALVATGARVRHSRLVQVSTSARQSGRTAFGFARQLAQWEAMEREHRALCVEPAAITEARFLARRALRRLWQSEAGCSTHGACTSLKEISVQLGVSETWLGNSIRSAETFGVLQQRVEWLQRSIGPRQRPQVDIRVAIGDLRLRLEELRRQSASSAPPVDIEPVRMFPSSKNVF